MGHWGAPSDPNVLAKVKNSCKHQVHGSDGAQRPPPRGRDHRGHGPPLPTEGWAPRAERRQERPPAAQHRCICVCVQPSAPGRRPPRSNTALPQPHGHGHAHTHAHTRTRSRTHTAPAAGGHEAQRQSSKWGVRGACAPGPRGRASLSASPAVALLGRPRAPRVDGARSGVETEWSQQCGGRAAAARGRGVGGAAAGPRPTRPDVEPGGAGHAPNTAGRARWRPGEAQV